MNPLCFLISNPSSIFSCLKKSYPIWAPSNRFLKFWKFREIDEFLTKNGVLRLSRTFWVVVGLWIKFYAHFLELGQIFFSCLKFIHSSSELGEPGHGSWYLFQENDENLKCQSEICFGDGFMSHLECSTVFLASQTLFKMLSVWSPLDTSRFGCKFHHDFIPSFAGCYQDTT